jgi:hypothetical protein
MLKYESSQAGEYASKIKMFKPISGHHTNYVKTDENVAPTAKQPGPTEPKIMKAIFFRGPGG